MPFAIHCGLAHLAIKAAAAGTVTLALSLAACGSSSEFAAICGSPGEGVSATKTRPAHIFAHAGAPTTRAERDDG